MRADDLDWLAFQYVAGELPDAEALAWEERLATDQGAREAVARAVELTQATALAAGQPALVLAGHAQVKWSQPLKWMALGAAASLIAILFLQQNRQPTQSPDVAQSAFATSSVDLAVAWAQTRDDSSDAETDLEVMPSELINHEAPLSELTGADAESDALEAPSWMLIAVAGLTGAEVVE